MSSRRVTTALTVSLLAVSLFGLGYSSARHTAQNDSDTKIDALRLEMLRHLNAVRQDQPLRPSGTGGSQATSGSVAPLATARVDERSGLVEEIKARLQREMGLLPLEVIRARRQSFVELYAYDNHGRGNYGTAGYLGDGYFITVKHGVMALGHADAGDGPRRHIASIQVLYRRRAVPAVLVDAGDAPVEVHRGDWAIVRVADPVDLPPLRVDLDYPYEFADPLFRLGNDYSKGIIVASGYVGQRMPNGLVTSLTDGHPGVSGGGILNQRGDLVGIPIGRMQGDFRFSFILPLRLEMFRKVPVLRRTMAAEAGS